MAKQGLIKWEAELAKQAEIAAGMEASTQGGQFFSLKGGLLSYNDAPFPNNMAAVVVMDAILENLYYEGAYDANAPSGPTCFAFGRDEKSMAPHPACVEAGTAQAESCAVCPHNEWGSATNGGKGKACRNHRRLALLPAGSFDNQGRFQLESNPQHYQESPFGFLKIPPTSIKAFAALVKQLAGTMKRPPHGVIMKLQVMPDPQTQFKVVFTLLQAVPDSLIPIVMERNKEAQAMIEFPYTLAEPQAKKPAKAQGRVQAKPAPSRSVARTPVAAAPQRRKY